MLKLWCFLLKRFFPNNSHSTGSGHSPHAHGEGADIVLVVKLDGDNLGVAFLSKSSTTKEMSISK